MKGENILKTGISGLDELFVENGIRKGSSILVTGAPGTGKSSVAWQFIYKGAKEYKEAGVIVTIEESAEERKEFAKTLGMDFEPLEKEGLVKIVENPLFGKSVLGTESLLGSIIHDNVKRVALDSLTLFKYFYKPESLEYRNELVKFITRMKKAGVTFMCTSERATTDIDNFQYVMEDFLLDCVVILSRIRKGTSFEQVLAVIKARGQSHSLDIVPVKVTSKGVEVYPKETPFALTEQDIKKKMG